MSEEQEERTEKEILESIEKTLRDILNELKKANRFSL